MAYFNTLLHLVFKLIYGGLGDDARWRAVIDHIGTQSLYGVLFAIVFIETGLVIMPFLPGDSLLFAVGAVGARDIGINVPLAAVLLVLAALCGDNLNYWVGRKAGPMVFRREDSKWLKKKHLERTQAFYETFGAKMVILARFVPIVRTFAPFVAGVGRMNYAKFLIFSIVGAIAWVSLCVGAGVALGKVEFVKKHFEVIVLAIIFISVLPMVVEFLRHRSAAKRGNALGTTGD